MADGSSATAGQVYALRFPPMPGRFRSLVAALSSRYGLEYASFEQANLALALALALTLTLTLTLTPTLVRAGRRSLRRRLQAPCERGAARAPPLRLRARRVVLLARPNPKP